MSQTQLKILYARCLTRVKIPSNTSLSVFRIEPSFGRNKIVMTVTFDCAIFVPYWIILLDTEGKYFTSEVL